MLLMTLESRVETFRFAGWMQLFGTRFIVVTVVWIHLGDLIS